MESGLHDAIYESDEDKTIKIVHDNPSLLPLALRYAVRYDRPLIINLLIPIAIKDGMGDKASILEDVTSGIVSEAINKNDSVTLNSMIYSDIIILYTILRESVKMGNMKYYQYALAKMEDSHLTIDPSTWQTLALLAIEGGVASNPVFRDILEKHHEHLDIPILAKDIVAIQSGSKLVSILSYKKYLDVNSLLITAMESHFHRGIELLSRDVDTENMDKVIELAASLGYIELLDTFIQYYKGDIANLAIDNQQEDIYRYLLDSIPPTSYTSIGIALANNGMLDDLIDLVTDIKDYTPVIEALVTHGYVDLISDLLDFEPEIVRYLPILYTAYEKGVYREVKDILFSYKQYVTPIDEAFNTIIDMGRNSIPVIRRMKIDLSPLREYMRKLKMYDIDRYLAY